MVDFTRRIRNVMKSNTSIFKIQSGALLAETFRNRNAIPKKLYHEVARRNTKGTLSLSLAQEIRRQNSFLFLSLFLRRYL